MKDCYDALSRQCTLILDEPTLDVTPQNMRQLRKEMQWVLFIFLDPFGLLGGLDLPGMRSSFAVSGAHQSLL
jgi:hypothetical protein